jgi:hypothetical protein
MTGAVVGIDLDNTIATYDALFHELATERGMIAAGVPASKRHVRDAVRQQGEGDIDWQRLQALAYGTRMSCAAVADGVVPFLARCQQQAIPVFVISHRTEYSPMDPERVPLREAALAWMRAQRLVGPAGLGVREDAVFFGGSRAEKIAQVTRAGCTHFIDDLEEVLLEPAFPPGVVKILYAPEATPALTVHDGVHVAAHWNDVHEVVFGDRP